MVEGFSGGAGLRGLADRMRDFGDTRGNSRPPSATVAAILGSEAEADRRPPSPETDEAAECRRKRKLADALHDKDVLLKEVHQTG